MSDDLQKWLLNEEVRDTMGQLLASFKHVYSSYSLVFEWDQNDSDLKTKDEVKRPMHEIKRIDELKSQIRSLTQELAGALDITHMTYELSVLNGEIVDDVIRAHIDLEGWRQALEEAGDDSS